MGWGGKRVGAGAKPKPKPKPNPFSVLKGDFSVPPAALTAVTHLATPPADLTPAQQVFWRINAPLAIDRETLTDSTVPSFRLLCELYEKQTMVGSMVDKGALGGLRVYMQLCKQVEGLMARFCLAPFGKPVKSEKPKPATAANPFAAFGHQALK